MCSHKDVFDISFLKTSRFNSKNFFGTTRKCLFRANIDKILAQKLDVGVQSTSLPCVGTGKIFFNATLHNNFNARFNGIYDYHEINETTVLVATI